MQLAAHELYDLHELTVSCVNSITNMGMFMNMVQDQELKTMLKNHFPAHVQDYNIKVDYLSRGSGTAQKLNVPQFNSGFQNFTAQQTGTPSSVTPRTDAQNMNDREIATAYLLTLKRAGREYAWAAMETSNPEVREFLKDAFTMSCNHAYDVWQWMAKKGFYPVEPASESTINTLSSMYQKVSEPTMLS